MRRDAIHVLRISLLFVALSVCNMPSRAQSVSEDTAKAAFLFRFTDYVDWPPRAWRGEDFTFAVFQDDGVATALESILATHRIKGHPARVKRIHTAAEAAGAQIVFLGAGDPDAQRRFIATLANPPALIVTDSDQGLNEGSTVNFRLIDRHLRFEVSLTAARQCGIQISSDLLSVAMRVEGQDVK